MDEEKYMDQLGEITNITQKKLQALQNQLTEKEIIKYRNSLDFFWLNLVESSVGEDLALHYLIELLNNYSKYQFNKNKLGKKSMDRFKRIKKIEKELK